MVGHGSHGHHEPYTVPDYKIYKVENCPELLAVQQALAAKGLKDPWLRNEVWRFNPKEFSTHGQRFRGFFFRGFGVGLGAVVVTMIGTAIWNKIHPSDHHGHGHH